MEYLSGGVFDCLYDEYFTLINSQKGLYEFLGYIHKEMEQLFHNHLWECIYREDRPFLKEEIEGQISSVKVFMYENRLITKGGEVRWAWISAELKQDALQRRYFHCIFHDITATKKDQEKLALNEKRYEIVLAQMQDIIFESDKAELRRKFQTESVKRRKSDVSRIPHPTQRWLLPLISGSMFKPPP